MNFHLKLIHSNYRLFALKLKINNDKQSIIEETRNDTAIPFSCRAGVKIINNVIIVINPVILEIKTLLAFSIANNFDVCI